MDELFEKLEESQMVLQMMRSSRFIDGVKQEVESWERKLRLVGACRPSPQNALYHPLCATLSAVLPHHSLCSSVLYHIFEKCER